MNSKIKAIGAAAMAGLIGIAGVAPAIAAPPAWVLAHRGHHMGFYHHGFHRGYYRYYRPHYYGYSYAPGYYGYGYDPGPAIVGGLVAGVFGAIAGSAIAHSHGGSHVARCERAYRSYVPATNTYTGYDGLKHICRL